ncbi:Tn3 family transposase [Streptomyces sp. NPDC000351]|uniref:Tn3 family transposase n=1 Tax=Streptomyces sp. NPDC000351 TaxID=3154250 RepID=UPI00331A7470
MSGKHRGGAIRCTEPEPQEGPGNPRRLKKAIRKAIRKKWDTVALVDILEDAALRTGMLKALVPVGTREAIDEAKLLERLRLIAHAYGTNSGIGSVAAGEPGRSEEQLRCTVRRYLTATGLKAAGVEIASATSPPVMKPSGAREPPPSPPARRTSKPGTAATSPSGISRYGSRGGLVYWHIEKGPMAIHSQLLHCTASEVTAIVCMVRHASR